MRRGAGDSRVTHSSNNFTPQQVIGDCLAFRLNGSEGGKGGNRIEQPALVQVRLRMKADSS